MSYAFGFAVIVIVLLVVDHYRQERRFAELMVSAFKQGDNHVDAQRRLTDAFLHERERMDKAAQQERSLLLARETNAQMVDGAAVASAMVERYQEQGIEKLHVSPEDDEEWAELLRAQRAALEAE